MVKIILIAHGDMAKALLDTAANICSFDEKCVDVFTVSVEADLEQIKAGLKERIDPAGTLILADLFGGTSCNIAASLTYGMQGVNIICGVNLSMLLTAASRCADMGLPELTKKVLEAGQNSIFNATEKLQ
jgi:mannose/fructose-specific phosphotransferase system component IIA